MERRIQFIDVAKGLCMILVVWQHCHTYYADLQTGEYYLESFRMPLFFCISGLFFKQYSNFKEFAKRKINSLLIPFFVFYLTFSVIVPNLLLVLGYGGLRQTSHLGLLSIFNFIFEKKYSNNPVWFLIALFWLNNIFYLLHLISKKISHSYSTMMLIILSLICGLIGFFLGVNHIFVWANIDNALTACPYFCLGYIVNHKTNILYRAINAKLLLAAFLIGIIYVIFCSPGRGYLQNDFPKDSLMNLYSCGVIGSISILALSKMINRSRILEFYGENTLIMLCMQMPSIQVVNIFIKHIGSNGYIGFGLTFIITLIILIPIILFFNYYLPWFTGKRGLL